MNYKTVDAGRGVGWIGDGWNLVKGQLGVWILLVIVYLVLQIVLQIIPFVGGVAAALITPGLVAGMFLAARYSDEGKTVDLSLLFQPLMEQRTRGALLTLGAVAIVFAILIALVLMAMIGGAMGSASMVANGESVSADAMLASGIAGMGFGGMLVILLLVAVYSMAMWFAPPLVLFAGVAPLEAMKLSFKAVLSNWLPVLVFGLLAIVLSIVAAIPLLLGFLLLMPVLFAAMYVSYKDVFDVPEEDSVVVAQPGMASSIMKM
ncbi:MAG: BPSS1780 family membrane protein [Halothiobacillaceae bacterium]|nr:BPSS1780 family membrane protein [Halothiobacillaceae bacterium]